MTKRRNKNVNTSGVPRTGGYKGVPHIWFNQPRDLPPFSFATIRAMLIDPTIRLCLAMRAAPLAGLEIGYKKAGQWVEGIECRDEVIANFIYRQIKRVWKNHIASLTRNQVWGWSAGEVTLRLSEDGLIEINRFEPRHAADCRLLKSSYKRWGIQVRRVEGVGAVNLKWPYAWFSGFNAQDGEDYGISACLGAYSPWADKWFNGGALDVRRLFMHKDAYGGADLTYPEGSTFVDATSDPVPNAQIARQIVEQLEAGGVTTRPSEYDANGKEKWTLTRASVPNNPQHILQYPQDLDAEIRHGLEVPDGIIDDDGTGAWGGKRVQMAAFYASLDNWAVQLFSDLKEQQLDPLVEMNFGRKVEYDICHKPLAEQAMEQQSNAGPGGEEQSADPYGMGKQSPFQMSLDPVKAVGEGALSAVGVVRAARIAMDERIPPIMPRDEAIMELAESV